MDQLLSSVHPPFGRRVLKLSAKVKQAVGSLLHRRSEGRVGATDTDIVRVGAKMMVKRDEVDWKERSESGLVVRQVCTEHKLPFCLGGFCHCVKM